MQKNAKILKKLRSRMWLMLKKHHKNIINQNGCVIVPGPLKNQRAWNIWWPATPITSKKSKSHKKSAFVYPHPTTRSYLACISSCPVVGLVVGLRRKFLLRLLWNLTERLDAQKRTKKTSRTHARKIQKAFGFGLVKKNKDKKKYFKRM